MPGNKGGIAFALIVVLAVAGSVGFVISPQPTSVLSQTIPANPAYKVSTTLYANVLGWDTPTSYGNSNGSIPINPTLNYTVGTVVTFTVIETDTLPHDLYIAKGSNENMAAYYSVIGAINPIPGSVYTGEWYALAVGTYTYWCEVHPTTMVGTINVLPVNSSSGSGGSPSVNPALPVGSQHRVTGINFPDAQGLSMGISGMHSGFMNLVQVGINGILTFPPFLSLVEAGLKL
ncbi:MAG: hypothetical protein QW597_00800 [Thermoplasmataceae archaeon]